jgi:leader peptidase (prepilin peptidase) / N-methyltransferase
MQRSEAAIEPPLADIGREPSPSLRNTLRLFERFDGVNDVTLRVAPALVAAVVSTVTDVRCGFIYDRVLLPAAIGIVGVGLTDRNGSTVASGALTAGIALLALYVGTRRRGIGLGDVKLASVLGASIGAVGAIEMLAVAFILGGIVALWLLLSGRKRRGDTIAFAPFLTAGFCSVLVDGVGR